MNCRVSGRYRSSLVKFNKAKESNESVCARLHGCPCPVRHYLVHAKTKKQTNDSDRAIRRKKNIAMTMSTRVERECTYRSSTLAWRINARLGPTTVWCLLKSEGGEKEEGGQCESCRLLMVNARLISNRHRRWTLPLFIIDYLLSHSIHN